MQDGKSNYISYEIQRVLQSKCIIKCWYYNRGEPQLWYRRPMRLQYKLGGTLRRLKLSVQIDGNECTLFDQNYRV